MRFDFTIHADNAAELQDALTVLLTSVPPSVFDRPNRGFAITAMPTFDLALARILPPSPATFDPAPVAADEATVPAPAKPARAPRTPKPAAIDAEASDEPEAEAEPAAPVAEDSGVRVRDDAADKLEAIGMLRDVYALPGGPKLIADTQAKMGVKKFSELPDEKGPELLAAAILAHKTASAAA